MDVIQNFLFHLLDPDGINTHKITSVRSLIKLFRYCDHKVTLERNCIVLRKFYVLYSEHRKNFTCTLQHAILGLAKKVCSIIGENVKIAVLINKYLRN